ncbi:MAG: DUF1622 domain-containing protein [Kofleriaceae bacterium]
MEFTGYIGLAARFMESGGIIVMLGGTLVALVLSARLRHSGGAAVFRSFRNQLGRAILLGLEFLVAADIIRTVSEVPTLEKVVVLAVIVLIRTFLSFALEVELEGRWPWQKSKEQARLARGPEDG